MYVLESRTQTSQGTGQCDDGGILWLGENQLQDEDCVHVLITSGLSWIESVRKPPCKYIIKGHILKGKLYKAY